MVTPYVESLVLSTLSMSRSPQADSRTPLRTLSTSANHKKKSGLLRCTQRWHPTLKEGGAQGPSLRA